MEEIRRGFHDRLGVIQRDILQLAGLVTEAVPRATDVLLAGDLPAAQQLIDGDDELDALSLEIEEACCRELALQQPMAGDLRTIVTDLRLVSELERSGDLAVNIAKAARRIYGVAIEPRLRGLIQDMSDEAVRIYRLAIDSYSDADADLAAALDDIDDRLDQVHADFIAAIFSSHSAQSLPLPTAVQLALVGRYYERIGDHAVNIGERVRYMVTGWLPEHTGVARFRARTRDQAGEP